MLHLVSQDRQWVVVEDGDGLSLYHRSGQHLAVRIIGGASRPEVAARLCEWAGLRLGDLVDVLALS